MRLAAAAGRAPWLTTILPELPRITLVAQPLSAHAGRWGIAEVIYVNRTGLLARQLLRVSVEAYPRLRSDRRSKLDVADQRILHTSDGQDVGPHGVGGRVILNVLLD